MLEKLKEVGIMRIIKYLFSSGTSFVLDLLLFSLFNFILKNVIVSTVLARVMSSLYNYLINSRFVFSHYTKSSIFKYYLLVIIQMFVSAFSVSYLSKIIIKVSETIIKAIVDVIIFVVNYFVQKEVVFK